MISVVAPMGACVSRKLSMKPSNYSERVTRPSYRSARSGLRKLCFCFGVCLFQRHKGARSLVQVVRYTDDSAGDAFAVFRKGVVRRHLGAPCSLPTKSELRILLPGKVRMQAGAREAQEAHEACCRPLPAAAPARARVPLSASWSFFLCRS